MSHTPGPWRVDESRSDEHRIAISTVKELGEGQWFSFAKVFRGPISLDNHEGESNARLIAAAPDLLAALEDISKRSLKEPSVDMVAIGLIADEAIKKARGE